MTIGIEPMPQGAADVIEAFIAGGARPQKYFSVPCPNCGATSDWCWLSDKAELRGACLGHKGGKFVTQRVCELRGLRILPLSPEEVAERKAS